MPYLVRLTHIRSGIIVEEIIRTLQETNEVYKFVVGFLRSCAEKKKHEGLYVENNKKKCVEPLVRKK